jgi:hypothetical protein
LTLYMPRPTVIPRSLRRQIYIRESNNDLETPVAVVLSEIYITRRFFGGLECARLRLNKLASCLTMVACDHGSDLTFRCPTAEGHHPHRGVEDLGHR